MTWEKLTNTWYRCAPYDIKHIKGNWHINYHNVRITQLGMSDLNAAKQAAEEHNDAFR